MHFAVFLIVATFFIQSLAPSTRAEDLSTGSGMVVEQEQQFSCSSGSSETFSSSSAFSSMDDVASSGADASLTSSVPAASPLLVRISEVLWMGSDLSFADEWVEIGAVPVMTDGTVTTETLSLAGWTLTIQKEQGEQVIATFGEQTIGSGDYLVVSNFPAEQSRLRTKPALLSSGMSVPNSKLLLRLRDASGALLDEVDDFVGVPFMGENTKEKKASMERMDLRISGTIKENWKTASTQRGIDAAAPVFGTPGYPNGTVEPPDTTPPDKATDLRAYASSGNILLSWTPSASWDLLSQQLTFFDADGSEATVLSLPASATGGVFRIPSGVQSVKVVSVDENGLYSEGTHIQVEPLQKPIMNELLPDPQGEDRGEWIELINRGSFPLDLRGWVLRRGTAKYMIPDEPRFLLEPQATLLLSADETKLTLPNAGGSVELLFLSQPIDSLTYEELPKGVSKGRDAQGEWKLYCNPTPGAPNEVLLPIFHITGLASAGSESATVNLGLESQSGSIAKAACDWDFGDGYFFSGCNPPAHAMKVVGDLVIRLTVRDYCGNTMTQQIPIKVLGKRFSSLSVSSEKHAVTACAPHSFSGVTINEFFPNPEQDDAKGEWIELKNSTNKEVSLCGWSIDDQEGGSAAYALDGKKLSAGAYLLLRREETGIALNNNHDMVRLIAPLAHGGTGVLLAVPYQDIPEGWTLALRDDSQWLPTQYKTPGEENRFKSIVFAHLLETISIYRTLPNPNGADTGEEYIELKNNTARPQWLTGWKLCTEKGSCFIFQDFVLKRIEKKQLNLEKTGLTLLNKMGALLLLDKENSIRSVLAWEKPKEGEVVAAVEDKKTPCEEWKMGKGQDIFCKTSEGWRGVNFAGIVVKDSEHYEKIANLLTPFMKDKKLELENDSINGKYYAFLDGVDVQKFLLSMGLAYASGRNDSARSLQYHIIERGAEREKRGIWSTEEGALTVRSLQVREYNDAILEREGLQLSVLPLSGLTENGLPLSVKTNVPAQLFAMSQTGMVVALAASGSTVQEGTWRFFAEYRMQTGSGLVRSQEIERTFVQKRLHYPSCIEISEIFPSPAKDENEWIELYNKCDQTISLAGWILDDMPSGGSKPYTLEASLAVLPKSYLVLSGSLLKVSLNNTGDQVLLRDPTKALRAAVNIPSVKTGLSYALNNASSCMTAKPTLGEENICVIPVKKATVKKSSSKKKKTPIIGVKTLYGGRGLVSGEVQQTGATLAGLLRGQMMDEKRDGLPLMAARNDGVLLQLFLAFFVALAVIGIWVKIQGRNA